MRKEAYSPPVDKLLSVGDCRRLGEWPDYTSMDLGREHIPELIRMATDGKLHWADSDSSEVWAPVHAMRAPGQLRAEAAIEHLVPLFQILDEADWTREELPQVLGMIGPAAIPALSDFLANPDHGLYPRVAAGERLEKIGNAHPHAKAECVSRLIAQLEKFKDNDPVLNGFIVW